jgi:hypothetical protein
MAAPGSPDIRGSDRQEMLEDIARGVPYAEIASKFNRHIQSVKEMAQRRAGEISVIRAGINAELHERLSDVPIADKARRIAVDGMLRDDLLAKLEDPDLEPRLRNQYTKTVMALQRAVAEELGDLRTTVDLTTTRSLADFDEVVLNEETGVYSAVAGTLHNASDG